MAPARVRRSSITANLRIGRERQPARRSHASLASARKGQPPRGCLLFSLRLAYLYALPEAFKSRCIDGTENSLSHQCPTAYERSTNKSARLRGHLDVCWLP